MTFDAGRLRAVCSPFGAEVTIVPSTASTNDDARAAARARAPHGSVFLADAQSRGRGRGDHRWHSPPGENLYLSLLLRPRLAAAATAAFALVAGVVVARVVEASAPVRASVKWPNDVLVDGRKVAGILVEASIRGDRVESLVAGVGLNVHTRTFPVDLAARATSLALLGAPAPALDRTALAAAVVTGLVEALARYEREGLVPFAAELRARDALLGAGVTIGETTGEAAGIDDTGRLLVRAGDGVVPVVSGEVTIHAPPAR